MEAMRLEAEDLRARATALPRSIWQRRADTSLSQLSGGIRLAVFTSPFIVRWAAWLVAALVVFVTNIPHANHRFEPYLLIGTFAWTLAVTFYVPVIRPVLLPALRKRVEITQSEDVLVMGLLDVTLAMTAVYLSGGWGSPYYHYALTALLIPAFFLNFRGGLVLAVAYTVAYVFGVSAFGNGVQGTWRDSNLNGFIGAVVTPVLVALVPNYLGSLLRDLDVARQDAVDALRDSDLLFRIGRAFLEHGHEMDEVLPHVAEAAREGSRFDRLVLLIPDDVERGAETHAYGLDVTPPEPQAIDEALPAGGARTLPAEWLPAPLDAAFADCAWVAGVPLRSSEAAEGWLIAGSIERPSAIFHEVRMLDAAAGQLALGVRNLRLSARIAGFAAEAERIRIAREIHDGIAQMVFMLSLSLETAIDRAGGDPEEQRARLRDLNALAKNALWGIRQYIFDLRPLLNGAEGLVGAIEGQVKEFRAVSELPVELSVTGTPVPLPVATSAELYRIVQEGLGNIFRHAQASSVRVGLAFEDGSVRLSITDDGVGIGLRDPDGRVGYGMGNLQERVETMSGRLEVRSTPGAGTNIEVTVPVGGAA